MTKGCETGTGGLTEMNTNGVSQLAPKRDCRLGSLFAVVAWRAGSSSFDQIVKFVRAVNIGS